MATPKKRKSRTPPGSANRTAKEKNVHLTFDLQNHQRGRSQQEVDHLVSNLPPNDGRTSVPAGGKAFDGGDKATDGVAWKTRKGKTVKK